MAEPQKPAAGGQAKPDEKKENKVLKGLKKAFKIFFCIVFFYIVAGYFVSWIVIRIYRWIYASIAHVSHSAKKLRCAKALLIIFFVSIFGILILFIALNSIHYFYSKDNSYIFPWFTIHFPELKLPSTWNEGLLPLSGNHKSQGLWLVGIFSILFDYNTFFLLLYVGAIFAFSISIILQFFIIVTYEWKIAKIKQKDEVRSQEAEYNGYEYKPNHPFVDMICKFTGYSYQEKIQHKIDLVSVKNKMLPTLSNGMLVSKKNKIIFYRQFWKNHAAFIGASKTGVTNDILNWVIAASYFHFPVIYIDSDGDSRTFSKVKSIADVYGSKFAHFNFFDQEYKYNPWYGKSYEEAADMLTYTFLGKEEIENFGLTGHAKIINDIFALMKINNDKINFKTILLYLDKSFLTKEFAQNPIAKPLIEDEEVGKITSKLTKDIKNFVTVFGKHLSDADTPSVYTIADVVTPTKNGSMLYILIPNKLGKDMKKAIKRLIFKDIVISSFVGKKDREERKLNVILCFNGIFELFYNPNEVSSSFASLTSNNFCLGVDLRGFTFASGDMDIIKEGIFCCSSLFIHKNSDKNVNTILTDVLAASRNVTLTFQSDEIKWKDKKNKSLENLKKAKGNEEEAKKKIITNLSSLQIGQLYFKTLHLTHIERFQKSSNIEEIIYQVPIEAQLYTDTLKLAS